MAIDWVNPKYKEAIENFGFDKTMKMSAGGNCSNCGGTGRHVYIDPNDGSMKDMGACMACGGSGQSSM